jgi:hypothetical protein
LHPDSECPPYWERVTRDGSDWIYEHPNDWTPITWRTDQKVRERRGTSTVVNGWRRKQSMAVYEAEHGTGQTVATPAAARARPAGPPPEPGIDRAKWIGERIAAMTAREDPDYLPHTRRRIAAHRAMSLVAGYSDADAENDGLTLPGGLLLHLEGLNAYAARAFAGLED